MKDEPRVYTEYEVSDHFLQQIRVLVNCWNKGEISKRRALEGLVSSILCIIDGTSCLPAFKLMPAPNENDEQFSKEEGENWYPNDCDISGFLEERWEKLIKEKEEQPILHLLWRCNQIKAAINSGDWDRSVFLCAALAGDINGIRATEKQHE